MAYALIQRIGMIKNRVKEKGQQDQRRKQSGEVLLSMTIMVFKMIALRLEGIVVLILNLPATAPSSDPGDNIVVMDGFRGRPRVAVKRLTLGVGDGEFTPIHPPCIRAVAQRHTVNPAICFGEILGSVLAGLGIHIQVARALEIRNPLVEQGVG